MTKRPVPTAEQLRLAATGDDLDSVLAMAMSEVVVLEALANAGQAVYALRIQVEALGDSQDEISVAIRKAHLTAERLLTRLAEASHLVIKNIVEREARAKAARYN
jgi:hypothetical protein